MTNFKTLDQYIIKDCEDSSSFVTDDGTCIAYQRKGGGNDEVIFIDFASSSSYTMNLHSYYGEVFSYKNQIVLVSWATNCIYAISKATGEVVNKQIIANDPDYNELNYTDSWYFDNGTIYICRSKTTELTRDGYPWKVRPVLYSYDVSTGKFQTVCSLRPVIIDAGSISVEMAGGYYWFYASVGPERDIKFLTRIPKEGK